MEVSQMQDDIYIHEWSILAASNGLSSHPHTRPERDHTNQTRTKKRKTKMYPETDEIILNQNGEATDLAKPSDFGQGLSFLNPSDMPDLDTAEVGFNIQPESLEFTTIGQSIRAFFNGFTFLKVKDKVNKGEYVQREAAVMQTKEGVKINMGANLVKQLKLIPVGSAIQITYKGEQRTNSGNDVKVYDVHMLNVPRANMPVVPRPSIPANVNEPKDEAPDIVLISPHGDEAVKIADAIWNVGKNESARQLWRMFPNDKLKLTAQEIKDAILQSA